jgi:hypothetical protein
MNHPDVRFNVHAHIRVAVNDGRWHLLLDRQRLPSSPILRLFRNMACYEFREQRWLTCANDWNP